MFSLWNGISSEQRHQLIICMDAVKLGSAFVLQCLISKPCWSTAVTAHEHRT